MAATAPVAGVGRGGESTSDAEVPVRVACTRRFVAMGGRDRPAFLRSVGLRPGAPPDRYPYGLPAVAGLDLAMGSVTVLVGDNGSGKSTLIEAVAVAAGFNAEGGSRNLRFETLHDRSHGQSFLALMESRFMTPGLYLMDEPESALSFQGQLQLLRLMDDGVAEGAQFVLATHSPILMRARGAVIYELDETGQHRVDDEDVTAVGLWRRFLDEPDALLAVLYADDPV